jgi:hypothetical protein
MCKYTNGNSSYVTNYYTVHADYQTTYFNAHVAIHSSTQVTYEATSHTHDTCLNILPDIGNAYTKQGHTSEICLLHIHRNTQREELTTLRHFEMTRARYISELDAARIY